MKRLFVFVLTGGLLMTATPSLGKVKGYSADTLRRIAARYGDCIVAKPARAQLAREYILNEADSVELIGNGRYENLVQSKCLINPDDTAAHVIMQFPNGFYRYALAEALVRLDFPQSRFAGFGAVPAFQHLEMPVVDEARLPKSKKKAEKIRNTLKIQQDFVALGYLAECVARADSTSTHALLTSPVTTPEEHGHFVALQPTLGACVPKGDTVTLNKTIVHGSLALAYYRLAYAASVANGDFPGKAAE